MLLLFNGSITFSWVVAPKGDVCVTCLSANLALQRFFQVINFHFTLTTEQQPIRNVHSYAHAFAVIFPPHAITTKFASTRTVNHRLFSCSDHLHGIFVNCIIKLLSCMKYFANCGFSKHLHRWTWHPRTSESNVNFTMFELTSRLLPTFRAWRELGH